MNTHPPSSFFLGLVTFTRACRHMSLGAEQNLQDCLALLVEALLTRSKVLVGTALPLNYDHHATTICTAPVVLNA